MKREELQQLYWIKLEIRELSMKIDQLKTMMAGGVSRISGLPRISGIGDRMGELMPEVADLEKILEEKLKRYLAELIRLETFIDQIDEAYLRLIFTYRYIKCLSWVQVAHRLGGSTADSVRMMHNRYLRNGKQAQSDR